MSSLRDSPAAFGATAGKRATTAYARVTGRPESPQWSVVRRSSIVDAPADRQVFDATLERRAQVRRLSRVLDRRGAGQQLGEERLHLYPGQVRAEAEVRSVAERQVRVRLSAGVEPVRVGEHGLVAVSRCEGHHDLVAGSDPYPGDLGIG